MSWQASLCSQEFDQYIWGRLLERSRASPGHLRLWHHEIHEEEDLAAAMDGVLAGLTAGGEPALQVIHEFHHDWGRTAILSCPEQRRFPEVSMEHEQIWARFWGEPDECSAMIERIDRGVPRRDRPPSVVAARFWRHEHRGGVSSLREIDCPAWPEIAANYPGLEAPLGWLMGLDRPPDGGRLIFWHGPPGTGKTQAVRALLRCWTRADASVITDPEQFLDSPSYLYPVLLARPRRGAEFLLLVLEDNPDPLLEQSRATLGQAMARLLNLTDGLIGLGLRLVVLITTNEPIHRIDPAFTRPGRALQVLEFRRFRPDEAARWLAAHGVDPAGLDARAEWTLAELYALLDPSSLPAHAPAE